MTITRISRFFFFFLSSVCGLFSFISACPPIDTFRSADEPLQIIESQRDPTQVVLHALEFHGDIAVVARALEGLDALIDLCVTVPDDRSAQVVPRPRREPARAGVDVHPGFPVKVLRMDVEGVGRHDRDGERRILVRAHKIADVDKRAEIVVRDGIDELFDPRGVLREIAVIFSHGFDALLLGVFRHLAAAFCEIRERVVIAPRMLPVRAESARDVVAHELRAHLRGEIDHSADPGDLVLYPGLVRL